MSDILQSHHVPGLSPPSKPNAVRNSPVSSRWPITLLSVAVVLYAAVVVSHWDTGYIDFGDGNYMYLSWRMAQGARLYADLLAPQPPMHLFTGTALASLAQVLGVPMLYAFRAFSLTVHLLAACLVAIAARACAAHLPPRVQAWTGVAAALIYLSMPIGFWWSLGYQSEHQEIVWLLLLFLAVLRATDRAYVLAGTCAALATLTNMTALPYALLAAFYLCMRQPRRAWLYAVPFVGLLAVVIAVMEYRTGAYLENVVFNQVGSFPRKEFLPPGENLLTYALGKLRSEGGDVLRLEGGYIVLSLVGLSLAMRRTQPHDYRREFAAWWGLASMGSIVYVSKGGTMDYIFCLGEPYVAAFAAIALPYLLPRATNSRVSLWRHTLPIALWVALGALALAVLAPAVGFIRMTLGQRSYELDAYTTNQIVDLIRKRVPEDGFVLSPPYYAFLAQRRIAEDYSELFLWSLKYYNEKQDGVRGRGVATVEKLAQLLKEKKVAFVVLDLDQTGRIPEIRQAIEEHYVATRQKELRTLNTRLMFYEPRR